MDTSDRSEAGGGLPGEIARDEARKARALSALFRVVAGGAEALRKLPEYIQAAGSIQPDAYIAACDELLETWTNTFAAPQPGHIREAARVFLAKSRAEIRHVEDKRRMARMKAATMTPAIIRAELARVHNIPLPDAETDEFEHRVEVSHRASLRRILDGMEGRPVRKPKMRKRGEGGLSRVAAGDGL